MAAKHSVGGAVWSDTRQVYLGDRVTGWQGDGVMRVVEAGDERVLCRRTTAPRPRFLPTCRLAIYIGGAVFTLMLDVPLT
jgi:hypothetical protein